MSWASGYLLCLTCDETHIGAWPVGGEPLECPYCDAGLCVPVNGEGFGDIPFENEEAT